MMRLMKLFAAIAILAGAMLLPMRPAHAQANGLLNIGGRTQFVRGVNLAWLDGAYSTDIGFCPVHMNWGCNYKSADENKYLADMHKMNANVCRQWLFEDMQGMTLNSSNQVTGLQSTFLTNLDNIVQLAGNNHMHMYFTLTDSLIGDGFGSILTDPTAQAMYINNAVIPLARRYKGNPNIFAFDVNNEIESQIGGSTGNYGSGITWAQAQAFIKAVASAIHSVDPTRLVTCTSGWHGYSNVQAGYFKNLGLDFYDCHVYQDTGSLPSAWSLNLDKPVICGEFGQATATWSDSIQNTCIQDLAGSAISNGWAGCGYWDYEYPGSTDYLAMVNSNGSWREGCYTLQNLYGENIDGDSNSSEPIVPGTYKIVNALSGLALDAYGAGTSNGTVIDQWGYGGGSNQRWNVSYLGSGKYSLKNVNASLMLDAVGWGGSGAWTDLWSPTGGANQQWVVSVTGSGYDELSPAYNTSLALDDYGASTSNYNPSTNFGRIDIWNWNNGVNQQWVFQSP